MALAGGLVGAGVAGSGPLAPPLTPLGLAPGPGGTAARPGAPGGPGTGDRAGPGGGGPTDDTAAAPTPDRSTAAERLGLAPGERAVALVAPVALPPVEPGDEVELVAVWVDGGGAVTAEPVGGPARVLALGDGAVTVALSSADAVAVLRHQAEGPIEIVVR